MRLVLMFPSSIEQVSPFSSRLVRTGFVGHSVAPSQFHRGLLFLLPEPFADVAGLTFCLGRFRLRRLQGCSIHCVNQCALLANNERSDNEVELILYGIAAYNLSPTQMAGAIPRMVVPGCEALVLGNPQRANDWLNHWFTVHHDGFNLGAQLRNVVLRIDEKLASQSAGVRRPETDDH